MVPISDFIAANMTVYEIGSEIEWDTLNTQHWRGGPVDDYENFEDDTIAFTWIDDQPKVFLFNTSRYDQRLSGLCLSQCLYLYFLIYTVFINN